MSDGLHTVSSGPPVTIVHSNTYILWLSRLIVNEKQQVIPPLVEFGLGLFSVQLVSMAFWVLSKAIAPNFSQ